MAPIALTSSLTSPPGVPIKKSQIAEANTNLGISLDSEGPTSPLSTGSHPISQTTAQSSQAIVDDNLPSSKLSPGDKDYFQSIIASSLPNPSTKVGSTVYGSTIDVIQALAVKHSSSIWVYDDAIQVGFGRRLSEWDTGKVNFVQTREGAGQELAGFASKTQGKISVFASTTTLPYLLSSLSAIQADIIIHLATTTTSPELDLVDSLFTPGTLKTLTSVPEGWEVVFSSGKTAAETSAKLYGSSGRFINVVESTFSGREITSIKFPATSGSAPGFSFEAGEKVTIVPAGHYAAGLPAAGTLVLDTLSPSADALLSALSGKTVSVVGPTKSDADALRTTLLAVLYTASTSSKTVLPTLKSIVASSSPVTLENTKTVSFYTAPLSPLPQLLAHLFLSSPTLNARLAEFGSASARGVKSVLALSPAAAPISSLTANEKSHVVWVSDANVLKTTDVLSDLQDGGILVLELPWSEEEVAVKLSRKEVSTIQSKNIRVFLLDLDQSAPLNPIREQIAFLLLYTGSSRLLPGVRKVLEAFYSGDLGRDEIEDAQASLSEIPPADIAKWEIAELEEGKTEKEKSGWEWDSLPDQAGCISVKDEEKPVLADWELAAKHLMFKEAFAVPEAKTIEDTAVSSLRPSTPDETFLVTVTENRRLTPKTYDRNVFHLELDSTGTGLKYEIGEAIGIHGWNDKGEVLEFIDWYGLKAEDLVQFSNPLKEGTSEIRTVFQLLQQNLDLFGKPGKAFYAELSKLATSRADAMALKFISAPEGAELFKKMAEKETVTFADVLRRYRTARPSVEELVGLIPEIKPRHYSIASSQKAVGDKVELLIVTVDWLSSNGAFIA